MNTEPRQTGLYRREFVVGGLKASLALFVWKNIASPVLAAPAASDGEGEDIPVAQFKITSVPRDLDDSLTLLAAFLTRYRPPPGTLPESGAWRARYDIVEWFGSRTGGKRLSRTNHVTGRWTMDRRPAPDGKVGYRFDSSVKIRGFVTVLQATAACGGGPLPGLLEWTTDYERRSPQGDVLGRLREQGATDPDGFNVSSAAGTRRFATGRPVAAQWAVMDAVRAAPADGTGPLAGIEFDYFHDLTSYRPRQRIAPCGRLHLQLGDDVHVLHGYLQTGVGSQPTHYWIDASGRPLLVTAGLLSWALAGVEPI